MGKYTYYTRGTACVVYRGKPHYLKKLGDRKLLLFNYYITLNGRGELHIRTSKNRGMRGGGGIVYALLCVILFYGGGFCILYNIYNDCFSRLECDTSDVAEPCGRRNVI